VMLNLVPVGAHAIRWRLWEESPGQMGLVSSRFDFTCKLLHANPFASPACLTGSYFYEKGKLNSYGTQKRQLPEGVNLVDNDLSGTKLKVVFIIGESGARNHYKTYGYQHGTDYFLSQVSGDGAFIVPHAIASSPITREALPRALSFASPISFDAFHDHKNIAELAKDAGFKTTWISNQRQVGYHDSSVGAIASSCAKTIFIQKGLKGYSSRLDQELINPFIDEILADYKKQFIFMHLAGSHRPYSDKYNEIDWLAAEKSSENLRPYDASVHQTDSVIKAIFEEMPKTDNWLIVYMPDHGENPLSSLGHGYSPLDRQELDIPLVALGSPAVVKTFKKSIARFSRVDGIFNTSNMIYVLGELLGYRYSAGIVESALVEADYVFHTDEKIYPINDLK
jgi:glucan phosphoethanolaminetransferase (alkaline phosphatase superfamily)